MRFEFVSCEGAKEVRTSVQPQRVCSIHPRVASVARVTLGTMRENQNNPEAVAARHARYGHNPSGLKTVCERHQGYRVPRNLGLRAGIPLGFRKSSRLVAARRQTAAIIFSEGGALPSRRNAGGPGGARYSNAPCRNRTGCWNFPRLTPAR